MTTILTLYSNIKVFSIETMILILSYFVIYKYHIIQFCYILYILLYVQQHNKIFGFYIFYAVFCIKTLK